MSKPNLTVFHIVEATSAGVARHILDLALGLQKFDVSQFIAYNVDGASQAFLKELETIDWVKVPLMFDKSRAFDSLRNISIVRKSLKIHNPSVVHGHSSIGGAIARISAIGLPVKVVYTPHGIYTLNPYLPKMKKRVFWSVEKILSKYTDLTICVSSDEYNHICSQGLDPIQCEHVANGINDHPDNNIREEIRTKRGFKENEIIVGFVGRFSPQKNIKLLTEVIKNYIGSYPSNTIKFYLVGSGKLWSECSYELDLFVTNGSVVFSGPNEKGFDEMSSFDIFLMTSSYEGFPYVLIEATRHGLPVVATQGCSPQGIVVNNENGHVCKDSISELTTHLHHLISNSSDRFAYGLASNVISQNFTADRMASETHEHYLSVTNSLPQE